MTSLTAHGICNAIGGKLVSGPFERVASGGVCTDSRNLPPHAVFFALGGDHFDGNLFAPDASRTAAAVVVSRVEPGIDPSCAVILVEDTLKALQQLASWWRAGLTLTAIGLTGSNGKTSTKDLTASVLSQGFRTIATKGNLNNHIGVPLSILQASPADEAAVWEMGMNHPGELAPLCGMTRPKIGIITSIGTSHIEYMGSRENIAREKCTVARCLPEDGFMIFPAECDYADMIRQSTRAACIDCGIDTGTVRVENPVSTENGTRFTLSIPDFCREMVELPVHGRHMVGNALLAAAAGWVAGLAKEQIVSGLNQAQLTGGRLHCTRVNDILVVDDTYNANPDSMQAALHTVAELSCTGRRFAVLGRMGELGTFSAEGHALVGRTAEKLRFDCVVSVGPDAARITDAISAGSCTKAVNLGTAEEAAEWLRSHTSAGDIVLFKGSRLARMEHVMNLTFPPQ